jgi:hypothetical protein
MRLVSVTPTSQSAKLLALERRKLRSWPLPVEGCDGPASGAAVASGLRVDCRGCSEDTEYRRRRSRHQPAYCRQSTVGQCDPHKPSLCCRTDRTIGGLSVEILVLTQHNSTTTPSTLRRGTSRITFMGPTPPVTGRFRVRTLRSRAPFRDLERQARSSHAHAVLADDRRRHHGRLLVSLGPLSGLPHDWRCRSAEARLAPRRP